jgi:hypothetical protein
VCGVVSSGSGNGSVAGSFEHSNEILGSVEVGNFFASFANISF